MEVAIKLAYEYSRRSGRSKKPRFLSLQGAYHGDTVGAVSLGHIDLFHKAYSGLLFKTDYVLAPYCLPLSIQPLTTGARGRTTLPKVRKGMPGQT